MKFSKGDVVVCIREKKNYDSERIIVKHGELYIVASAFVNTYNNNTETVELVGDTLVGTYLYASRFEHVTGYETNPVLRKIKKMEERFNKRKVSCAA